MQEYKGSAIQTLGLQVLPILHYYILPASLLRSLLPPYVHLYYP